jgi:hypothetical protein
VTLPDKLSKHIRQAHGLSESGWGRLKVNAKLKTFEWATSIWFDTKHNAYLLAINAKARKATGCQVNDIVDLEIVVHDHTINYCLDGGM